MFPTTTTRRFSFVDAMLVAGLAAGTWWLLARGGPGHAWDWGLAGRSLARWDEDAGGYVPGILAQGLFTTLRLSAWATLLAAGIGLAAGLARTARRPFVALLARGYVELARNTPPLVLVFILYFFVGGQVLAALGLDDALRGLSPQARRLLELGVCPPQRLGEFLSALAALALYEGAYIAEIVRAGVQSIERGQWEAAHALGLSRAQRMRHVILPQALKRMLPPLAGQFISTVKDSAIVSVISIPELTFQGMELMASTGRALELWTMVLGLYLAACLTLSLAARRLERPAGWERR